MIGGVKYSGHKGVLLKLDHVVKAERENHHQCGAESVHHHGAMTAFEPIEKNDDKFSERGLKNEGENHKHFDEN